MAMNEDSVVSSLNELRRMANERSRKEAETRRAETERQSAAAAHGRRSEGRGRNTRTLTEGYPEAKIHVEGLPHNGGGQWEQGGAGAPAGSYGGYGAGNGYAAGTGYAQAPYGAQYAEGGYPAAEATRRKSSTGPVLLTILILGGAGVGGFMKLRQDMATERSNHEAALKQANEQKSKAVEAAARSEATAKVQIAALETKLKSFGDKAAPASSLPPPAAAAAAAAAPAEAKKVASAPWSKKARARARFAAKRSRASAALATIPAAPPEEKKAALPKIAGKKKITDDPLAGLKM